MKALGSTEEVHLKPYILSTREADGIPSVEVKFIDIGKNTGGKAVCWLDTDAETRKRGEQTGLDTLVVHAVNDVH